MARIGDDTFYLEAHKRYLKYSTNRKGKTKFTSYKFKEYIIELIESYVTDDILRSILPDTVKTEKNFCDEFRKVLIENEYQRMYEFLKYSQSYYLDSTIAPIAICKEILLQTRCNKEKNGLRYEFTDKNKNWSVQEELGTFEVSDRSEIDYAYEEKEYSLYAKRPIASITRRFERMHSKNVITPYKVYMLNYDNFIFTNYCRLYMEICRPFSHEINKTYANPLEKFVKDDQFFYITHLANLRKECTERLENKNEKSEIVEMANEHLQTLDEYIKRLSLMMNEFIELYDNVINKEWPKFFDANLWCDNKFLEEYLLEKILGLNTISYLCQLNFSKEKIMAIARMLNPIGNNGFNSMHKYVINNILSSLVDEELADYMADVTVGNRTLEDDYDFELDNRKKQIENFMFELREITNSIHKINVGYFVRYLKRKRTFIQRQQYFQSKFDKRLKEIEVMTEWEKIKEIKNDGDKDLMCALLYNKLEFASNRRFINGDEEHLIDKNKKISYSTDIEGHMELLYAKTIDPFLFCEETEENINFD